MGLFSKKNEEDFLSQQLREEGKYSSFEEQEYNEVKNNVDAPDRSELKRNYNTEINTPSGTQQSYTQNTTPPVRTYNPPAADNEPAYRQYRSSQNTDNQQKTPVASGKGIGGAILIFLLVAGIFFGSIPLIAIGVVGLLSVFGSSKNKKK